LRASTEEKESSESSPSRREEDNEGEEEEERPLTRVTEVYTIGHSTRAIEDFVSILEKYEVEQVVDVRRFPRSGRNPQFNVDALPQSLEGRAREITYVRIPGLGGRRRALPDSPNKGWRNSSFRGYADYMQTSEFRSALEELIDLAKRHRVAIMCAESVPWRCHRSLIADALLVRGVRVTHILSAATSRKHALTPFARVRGVGITYPGEEKEQQQPSSSSFSSSPTAKNT
jgi:uncharacterized protein (DUF488 family)